MTNPVHRLVQSIFGNVTSQAIAIVAKLRVADQLKEGPKSIEELAETTSTHVPSLYRVMRLLTSQGIFKETDSRCFTLTVQAELLLTDAPNSLRDFAIFQGGELMNRPLLDLLHSVQTGEPVCERTFGQKPFEYMQHHPEDFAIFNDAMTSMSRWDAVAVRDAYDFSDVPVIVDVGGGHGLLLAVLLNANPSSSGILFDLPHVVEGASELLETESVMDRCRIIGGDFFTTAPEGGDLYIIKRVIHDWDDEKAKKIIENCRKVMGPKAKVLVVDPVIPLENLPSISESLDIVMLTHTGGLERTEDEFRDLFSNCGLRLTQVVPTNAWVSIVEGVPV